MTDEIRTNTIFVGRYQMQRELGRGGMGSVYLAFDMQFRKPVAIKVARLAGPEARAQFRREALYLQRLRHHNLPQVLDIFSDTQRDFLVMEYIPGDDLEARVQQQGPQPEWLVLRWADELLDVLDYLHTQTPPIIHRDIKPGNLKLRQNDTLVLVDFGIAAEHRPEETEFVGATAVTPGFSPPEQYTDSPADARSDVYSAGATLYYLLTGVIPAAAPERASNEAALAPVRKLASKTSANTDALLSKALNLASEERWANAAEMRRAAVVAARKLAS
ncbi:MAG TPA: serine/threonine-protein kinase, partial [Anaerolineae bacterium]|nr:serine/threonine-protein kinase [Anaerolineae bacterium]